jgi:hypothetical protein
MMATKTAIRDLNESSLSRASGAMPVQEVKTEPVSNHLLDDQGGHWTQVYHPKQSTVPSWRPGKVPASREDREKDGASD